MWTRFWQHQQPFVIFMAWQSQHHPSFGLSSSMLKGEISSLVGGVIVVASANMKLPVTGCDGAGGGLRRSPNSQAMIQSPTASVRDWFKSSTPLPPLQNPAMVLPSEHTAPVVMVAPPNWSNSAGVLLKRLSGVPMTPSAGQLVMSAACCPQCALG